MVEGVQEVATTDQEKIKKAVSAWLDQVVIGLNLCPFARKPRQAGQISFVISQSQREEDLLADLLLELQRLDKTSVEELETTLLIIPYQLQAFADFNQFLDLCDWLLERHNYTGIYQLATFHPDYQFADTLAEDAENLTNRAPYPVLHLIRESSLENALKSYRDPETIPENNIRRMQSLNNTEKQHLFPYLFANK